MALKIRRCEFVLPAENVRTGQRQRFCLEPSVELKEIRSRWPSAARVIPLSLNLKDALRQLRSNTASACWNKRRRTANKPQGSSISVFSSLHLKARTS
jgi:hypothetical protein